MPDQKYTTFFPVINPNLKWYHDNNKPLLFILIASPNASRHTDPSHVRCHVHCDTSTQRFFKFGACPVQFSPVLLGAPNSHKKSAVSDSEINIAKPRPKHRCSAGKLDPYILSVLPVSETLVSYAFFFTRLVLVLNEFP